MPYNDSQLKDATQIAYADLQYGFDNLVKTGRQPPFSIKDIKAFSPIYADLSSLDNISDDCLNWEIPAPPYDTNDKTGFYGCVINTGDGNAIVGFRGSEGMGDMDNVIKDWIGGDLDLLIKTQTAQQAEAEKFMKEISESDYIDNYDNLALTGHSLGGNLADHAAIISGKYGLDKKISQEVSFDGPGFSDEYIALHHEEIANMSRKMTHYKWSLVGELLNELPGVNDTTLAVKPKSDIAYLLLGRHATTSLLFDKKGNAIRGEANLFALIIGGLSEAIDNLPKQEKELLVFIIGIVLIGDVFRNELIKLFDESGIKSWYNENFNEGYKCATANPFIEVNTYNLRHYADRLSSVNRKINNLDQRLDDLYFKVGLENLGNLFVADLFTGTSDRICRCVSYLNDTAYDFEATERSLLAQISGKGG
jgi:hypothetical protein